MEINSSKLLTAIIKYKTEKWYFKSISVLIIREIGIYIIEMKKDLGLQIAKPDW